MGTWESTIKAGMFGAPQSDALHKISKPSGLEGLLMSIYYWGLGSGPLYAIRTGRLFMRSIELHCRLGIRKGFRVICHGMFCSYPFAPVARVLHVRHAHLMPI
jgi:hypothetical protein